jgi:hypothetical protein
MKPEGDITSALGSRKEVDLWEGDSKGGVRARGKMGGGTLPQQNKRQKSFQPCQASLVTMPSMLVKGSTIYGALEFYDASG